MENLTIGGWGMLIVFLGFALAVFTACVHMAESIITNDDYYMSFISKFLFSCSLGICCIGGLLFFIGIILETIRLL